MIFYISSVVAVLKGHSGKCGKGGKWGQGKGECGEGKGCFVGKGYKGYRSPCKAIGKGFNYWGEDEYAAAWGSEMDYYSYDADNWHYGYGESNYIGIHMMLLESSRDSQCTISKSNEDEHAMTHNHNSTTTNKQLKAVSGRRGPLKGTECTKVVTTHNEYIALTNEDDDDNDSDNDHDHDNSDDNWRLVEYKKGQFKQKTASKETGKYPITKERPQV